MRELRVLPGADGGVDRHHGPQPMVERPALRGRRRAGQGPEPLVDLECVCRYGDRPLPELAQPPPERGCDPGLANASRSEQGDDGRSRHRLQYRGGMSLVAGRVLITGATGGIGLAIARAFADRGATLVISGRRSEILDPLAAEVRGRAVVSDLGRREDVERLVAQAGEVDVLVANAALPASGVLTELTQEQIDRMLEINLRAPIPLARA